MNVSILSAPVHRFFPFARISARTALWSALTGVALVLPAFHLVNLLPLPPATGQEEAAAARIAGLMVWMLALKAVIIFPVVEECLYRGLLLPMLRRSLPLWAAIALPSLLFGLTHFGLSAQNAAFATLVGLYFSWLAIRSGSVLPAILCHGSINFFGVFILRPLFGGPGVNPSMLYQPLPLCMLAVSLAVLLFGARRLQDELTLPAAIPAAV